MLGILFRNVHVLILIWIGYSFWMFFEEHQEQKFQLENQIQTIKLRIAKREKEKSQLINYFKDIDEAKKRIELVAQEVDKIKQQLPSDISDADNLEKIDSIAKNLNIKNIILSPEEEENKGFYFTKRYTLKATGTFLQFLIFFEKIGESKQLLNIADVVMDKTEAKQRGRFQLINATIHIEAYRYNKSHRESRGIEEIEDLFDHDQKEKKKKEEAKT